ncbi:hypothetical protein OROGR_002141 [Orobanche gracilis]
MVGSPVNSQDLTLTPIKFVCSYGGRILPRYPDGKLRYHGGETRVLSVDRSISFSDLLVKLGEMCGNSVSLRCQLPAEDLDVLVSITSDEDFANLIEEYDRAAAAAAVTPQSSLKIRAFLSASKTSKKSSSPTSPAPFSSKGPSFYSAAGSRCAPPTRCNCGCTHHALRPPMYPGDEKAAGKFPYNYAYQCQYHPHRHHHHHHNQGNGNGDPVFVNHNCDRWQ